MNASRGDNITFSQKQSFKMASSHRPLSFSFSQNSDLPMFLIFHAVGGIRRVQIPRDICTRFGLYLYSFWALFIQELVFNKSNLVHNQRTLNLHFDLYGIPRQISRKMQQFQGNRVRNGGVIRGFRQAYSATFISIQSP